MYIPESMKKENKFIDVAIPSNRQMFARLGEVKPTADQFTGDEEAVMNQDKISQIEAYQKYAEKMAEEYDKSDKSE